MQQHADGVVWSPEKVAQWSEGVWQGKALACFQGVALDSRNIPPGSLFVALKGDRHDAHDFVEDAFHHGAAAALVSREFAAAHRAGMPLLVVDDPHCALMKWAGAYRRSLAIQIIGVTGSAGKTSVKEMTAHILSGIAYTAKTIGNFNNNIGLPLSLLTIKSNDRYGVFEVGMNHPGELAPLCQLLSPDRGVISSVGTAHIEFFGSVREIAEEKATLLRALPPGGVAVVSRDSSHFDVLAAAAPAGRLRTVSLQTDADYRALWDPQAGTRFRVIEKHSGDAIDVNLSVPGRHMVGNALLAIAVARGYHVPWDRIVDALATYAALPHRWTQMDISGVRFVDDAYNANPESMRAALETFAHYAGFGRAWVVLAGMRELGHREYQEHASLGRFVAAGKWAGVLYVGDLARQMAVVSSPAADWVHDHAQAVEWLRSRVQPGDAVLLKGSRGEQLEKIIELFTGKA